MDIDIQGNSSTVITHTVIKEKKQQSDHLGKTSSIELSCMLYVCVVKVLVNKEVT